MLYQNIHAEEQRLSSLRAAYQRYESAKDELALINKCLKSGSVWTCRIVLEKSKSAYKNDTTTEIDIPSAWVQQQAVNRLTDARRRLILLGGIPS